MLGPPQDVDGECNARLYLADDWGNNSCTIRCHLPSGHTGRHQEEFERDGMVTIQWEKDEGKREYDSDS